MEQAGRMELDEFHVRHAAAGAPGHRDAVAGRGVGIRGVQIDLARAAGGEHRMRRLDGHGAAAFQVERIQTVAAAPRQTQAVGRDQVDRVVVFEQRDVRMAAHALAERGDHRVAGCVRCVNDPPMAMAAFARQVKAEFGGIVFGERHALLDQPFDRRAPVLDDEARGRFVAQAAAGDQRVADMVFDAVRRIQHGGDAALRPVARAFGHRYAWRSPRPAASPPDSVRRSDLPGRYRQSPHRNSSACVSVT